VEVCYVALTGASPPAGQEVLFMQVDGRTASEFGGGTALRQKLAGVQLGHFGAFYKRSWRVNDWTWGRVDGATRLVEAVLGAKRLRQLRYGTEELMDELRQVAVGPDDTDGYLAEQWAKDAEAIRKELTFLDDHELPVPPSVPQTARAVARRLHIEVLRDELRPLAAAVEFDRNAKAAATGNGPTFADAYWAVEARHPEGIPARQLVSLFAGAKIGEEQITKEVGTDLLAATASTAAAVTVATLDVPQVKLGPARAVLRSLRAVTLAMYALVYGAARGSRVGAAAVNLALCVGGALLAVSLLSDSSPPFLTALAAVLVIAGIATAALRSRAWLLALALGVPLVILAAAAVAGGAGDALRDRAPVIATVVGLVLGTALLGSIRIPDGPMVPVRTRTVEAVVVFAVSAAAVVGVAHLMADRSPGRVLELQRAPTVTRADAVLSSWADDRLLDRAVDTLVLDYVFLAFYWVPLAILVSAVAWACRGLQLRRWWTVGSVLSWLPIYAALLDAAENVFMLLQVDHYRDGGTATTLEPIFPAVTFTLALVKWLFVVAVGLYIVVLGGRALIGRLRGPSGLALPLAPGQ
jgi:hypothetical protein